MCPLCLATGVALAAASATTTGGIAALALGIPYTRDAPCPVCSFWMDNIDRNVKRAPCH